jgi:Protein of unknown function (DUF3298)/Deacetylase PdaC
MNGKLIGKFVVAAILVGVIGFILGERFSPQRQTSEAGQTASTVLTPTSSPADSLAMYIIASKDVSNPLYRISVEYSQFSGEESLDKSISDAVNSKINEFKSSAKENWKAREDTTPAGVAKPNIPSPAPFYFSQTWQPKQLNRHYASFLMRFNSFAGGANERQEIMAFNYDLGAKKSVSLSDIFSNVPNYLQQISQLAKEQLSESLNVSGTGDFPVDILDGGTSPTPENFQNFVFDDDTVEFFFPKYQVAPGVYGEQHVAIPRTAIR